VTRHVRLAITQFDHSYPNDVWPVEEEEDDNLDDNDTHLAVLQLRMKPTITEEEIHNGIKVSLQYYPLN
jgi:hypothetical protein